MILQDVGRECGSGYEQVVGSSKHGNEPQGSIKFGKFLDCFRRTNMFYEVT